MNILHKLITITVFSAVLISGCSMLPPSDKPFLATEYLHRAEMAGAAEFAPEDYQRLLQEYSQLEELHLAHQDDAVNKRLPLFAEQIEQLIELTRQNINREEALADPATTAPAATTVSPPSLRGEAFVTAEIERIAQPRSSYTVSEGELLWTIAKRTDIYSDPFLWPLLYQANRDQIKDPRKIYAGQTLSIPRNVSDEEREKARSMAKKSNIFSPE